MFGNFIYFIVVLLIYATYQPAEDTQVHLAETLILFLSLLLIFVLIVWMRFRRLEKRLHRDPFHRLDHGFTAALTRLSILAILLFAVDVYLLDLGALFAGIPLFNAFPTLEAILFLGLFVGYLAIIWAIGHRVYRQLYAATVSRRSYVASNISFAVPVLLPWLVLSTVTDLIHLLPFQPAREFLTTTEGEILYFLVFLFAVAILGPLLIQKFWRCKPLEPGYERGRIELLCRKAGLQYADILYWPIFGGRMITAGVMGLVKRFRYILVTEALLTYLKPEEVEAVIAHEIGHIKRYHLLFYLFFFVGYMLISYATFDLIVYGLIYLEPFYDAIQGAGFDEAAVTSVFLSVLIIAIFLVYFRFIFGYFMRNFERQADTYVYQLFDSALPLISTFEKITLTSGQPPEKPNWHHYSISERIGYLKKCEADRRWIGRHDRKVKRSVALYGVGILLMGLASYHLNFGEAGRRLDARLFEKVILREIESGSQDPNLYRLLGDYYYSRENYEETAAAYEKSLELKPDSPEVLNNLAWLYATAEKEGIRKPRKALELARKAADLSRSAHILDTLAEAYYVNGRRDKAVEAAEAALEIADKKRGYYERQLEKFRRGGGG
jgi:Zn-dependent protease with chaperone function